MQLLKLFPCFLFILSSLTLRAQNPVGFEFMVNGLLEEKVDTIGALTLNELIRNDEVVILDAREFEEFQVSHLKGALHVGYQELDEEVIDSTDKTTLLVVYCSVGKRSEEVGELLQERGFDRVYNLYGGIFDWTNRGFSVVNEQGESVKQVHPYNALWGIWINNYDKVYGSE